MTIEELIEEYQRQVQLCDTLLAEAVQKIDQARKEGADLASLSRDRAVFNARRQAYVQFIADLKDVE